MSLSPVGRMLEGRGYVCAPGLLAAGLAEIRAPELILVLVEEPREARVRQIPAPLLPSLL